MHRIVRCRTEETRCPYLTCNDIVSKTQNIDNIEGIISLTYINMIIMNKK